jgi:hypothetical protein
MVIIEVILQSMAKCLDHSSKPMRAIPLFVSLCPTSMVSQFLITDSVDRIVNVLNALSNDTASIVSAGIISIPVTPM